MTTFELLQAFDDFLSTGQTATYLLESLANLSRMWDEILVLTAQTQGPTDNNQVIQKNSEARGHADQAAKQLRQFSASKIIIQLDAFQRSISVLDERMQEADHKPIHLLPELAAKFLQAYEEAIKHYARPEVILLLARSNEFYSSLLATQQIIGFLKANLEFAPDSGPDVSDIELFLPSVGDLQRVASKLQALAMLYEELCDLLTIPRHDRSFQILRIEAGSLFVKGRGRSQIIRLLSDFLREGASYLYRNYTKEGQITSIPKKVESLDAVFGLSERLRQMGLDTTQIDKKLQKSSAVIASQLNQLLADQPSVVVNQNNISVATIMEPPRLKPPPLQIEQRETPAKPDDAVEGTNGEPSQHS